jgi:hypothetical protein
MKTTSSTRQNLEFHLSFDGKIMHDGVRNVHERRKNGFSTKRSLRAARLKRAESFDLALFALIAPG